MGNTTSNTDKDKDKTKKDFDNFYEIIDYIATYYILTMDFKSLRKLSEKEYCDKLIILTSDIIDRYFNDLEVTYLAQRVKEGLEVNELKSENIRFLNKDQLESLDVKNDAQKSIKKKRVCIGIAKFYIKIAHVFAAIVMTINPVYMYQDSYGNVVKVPLLEKDKIPKNVQRKVTKLNICDHRINILKHSENYDDKTKTDVNVHPKLCSMNLDKNGVGKNLSDEPGIQELLNLYLDDKYDYSNGTFTGMSDSTKSQFKKDLKMFYMAFTGNEVMPPEIQKFSDIKLRDYHNQSSCKGNNALFKQNYKLNKNDKLFVEYANNIKNMIQSASSKQNELLSVINDLFSFVIDPYTGKKRIRVNPKLTEQLLQKNIEKSRKTIIELYIKCENDFVNGVKLYEAIVESKILETTKNQISALEKESSKIISESTKNSNPSSSIPPSSTSSVSVNNAIPTTSFPTINSTITSL